MKIFLFCVSVIRSFPPGFDFFLAFRRALVNFFGCCKIIVSTFNKKDDYGKQEKISAR
jgi:hypothetical protein